MDPQYIYLQRDILIFMKLPPKLLIFSYLLVFDNYE